MRWCWMVPLVGCSFSANPAGPADGGVDAVDAAPDAPPDAFDASCFGSGAYYFCLAAPPTQPVTLAGPVNTSTCSVPGGEVAMLGTSPVCVIAGTTITLASNARIGVYGSRPLVLAATDTLTIEGIVDASSVRDNNGAILEGPNANPSVCDDTGIDGTNDPAGGGAGAGGSFGSRGGNGGTGGSGLGAGGQARPATASPVTGLRGGCRGGSGANDLGDVDGGDGGGAVYLVARGALAISGTINASGAGGNGGTVSKGGGGGGGAGGMIVLHAADLTVMTSARVIANGGGAGGGAGNMTAGNHGSDPSPELLMTPAPGGSPGGGGISAGGRGAAGGTPSEPGPNHGNGAGGGGGGAGVIRVLGGGVMPPANVSPSPS